MILIKLSFYNKLFMDKNTASISEIKSEIDQLISKMEQFLIHIKGPQFLEKKFYCCVCLDYHKVYNYINFKCKHGLCKSCYREVELCPLCRREIVEEN